jgi:putative oxidoreductase
VLGRGRRLLRRQRRGDRLLERVDLDLALGVGASDVHAPIMARFPFSDKSDTANKEENVQILDLIGRILFVAMFVQSGIRHLTKREAMVAYARGSGAPAAAVLVPLTGVQILVGGLMVALGVLPDLGGLLIALFLLPTAWFMHGFWRIEDPGERMAQEIHFMKNVSLAGAALVLTGVYALCADRLWMLTGSLF